MSVADIHRAAVEAGFEINGQNCGRHMGLLELSGVVEKRREGGGVRGGYRIKSVDSVSEQ